MHDAQKAHAAQEAYCQEHGAPHFAPGPNSGYKCFRCKQNIYAEKGYSVVRLPRGKVRLDYSKEVPGYSVEKAGGTLICGCPFCYASYCD